MELNDDRVYVLGAPSTIRMARELEFETGNLIPVRIGRVLMVPGLEQERPDQVEAFVRPKVRTWQEKPRPRYVLIGQDTDTVYSWPAGWVYCREFALGRFVRRVGRLVSHELILDGHYFLERLGRAAA